MAQVYVRPANPAPHPLDQLSPSEVERAASVCLAHAAAGALGVLRFNVIIAQEPVKSEMLAFSSGRGPQPRRIALCVIIVPSREQAVEARVLLGGGASGTMDDTMLEWKLLEGVHPMTTPDDNFYAEAIVKADPRIVALVAERYGVTDVDTQLSVDTWACHDAPDHLNARRLMQGFLYVKVGGAKDNEYAHPIDLVPIVDLNKGQVVHIDMYDRPSAVPPKLVNYHRDLLQASGPPGLRSFRPDLMELNVSQPQHALHPQVRV